MTVDDAVLIDYALGTVSREQALEVESFLRASPEAAARVRRMQDDLSWLVMTLPPQTVDQAAEEALIERLRATTRPPLPHERLRRGAAWRSPRWAALGLAAALGIAAWLILGPLVARDSVGTLIERYESQPGALSSRLIMADGSELGTLVRLRDGRLFVAFDEKPVEGVYQLWTLRGDDPASLGVVDGLSQVTEPVDGASGLAITVEPEGGSERPTSEPLVVEPL